MITFNNYVNASCIWEGAKDHKDMGDVVGYVRGYNIEVMKKDGTTFWKSCEWFYGSAEEHYNDEFHRWMYEESDFHPTGRICFRGYGEEEWDEEERDYFINTVPDSEVEYFAELSNEISFRKSVGENIEDFFGPDEDLI